MDDSGQISAEIISIGDELLIGQTVNTNAAWIGEQLSLIGVRTVEVFTIPDDHFAIMAHLQNARADIILLTGGLGPTKDDITKVALCDFFETRLIRDKELEERIVGFFKKIGREALEVNRAQADLPETCTKIPNKLGTASGMWFDKEGKVFVSMPGVPYEMKKMMTDTILPALKEKFHTPNIVHRTIQTTGLGESHLAERIMEWESSLSKSGIKLAYLPSPGLVKLRLSSYADNGGTNASELIDQRVKELKELIPDLVFGEGRDKLEEVIGRMLAARGEFLSTAESCTGGAIARKITSVPGSSGYFDGSVVSYSNEAKIEILGVSKEDLDKHGAVSEPVVEQMALGARMKLNSDWSIATSGIAGPDGGTEEKPVGTVWLAVAGPTGIHTRCLNLPPGERNVIIQRSARAALNLLRKTIKKAADQQVLSD